MIDALHRVKWYGGVNELPKTVAKVRPGDAVAAYRAAGIEMIVTEDLPPGVMAIMGYRNADGSFQEGAVRLVSN